MLTSKSSLLATFTSAALVAGLGGIAAADPYRASTRDGATFGVGIGAGHMGCDRDGDDCDGDGTNEAGGLNLRAGLMLTPNLAIAGDVWGMAHTEDSLTVTQTIAAGVLRGWATNRLWFQGGLGVAHATAELDLGDVVEVMSESDTVPAIVGGVGVEVLSTDSLALDVELKAGTGLFEDDLRIYNVSLGAGVSFY